MKIAYLSKYDVHDVKKWSGTVYNMFHSLQSQGLSVEPLGSFTEPLSLLLKGKQYIYKRFLNKEYMRDREPFVLNSYSSQIQRRLSEINPDVLFSQGTIPIAHLESDLPIVFWTDACFAGMLDFYPRFSNLCQESILHGHKMEKRALEKSTLAIYASDWAARTAINSYGIDESKVRVVPFGANIPCDRTMSDVEELIARKSFTFCNLLFIGVDWERKGGAIALKVASFLNDNGISAKLTVVGCNMPENTKKPDFIDCLGFIDKTSKGGMKTLTKLFSEAHFLILPSRAECYGVVFCEANSFGVPCISADVGGISTVIKNDLNGRVFSLDAQIEDYCEYISEIFSNPCRYRALAVSSFREYESRLNWSSASQTVSGMITEVIEKKRVS